MYGEFLSVVKKMLLVKYGSLSFVKESSVSNSSTEDKIVDEMLWNTDKDKKLNDFMNTWGANHESDV